MKLFSVDGASASSSIKTHSVYQYNSSYLSALFVHLHYLSPGSIVSSISIFPFIPFPSPSPGTLCGYILPPVLVSATDTVSIAFQSDSRLTDRGFSAKWEAVYPEDIAGTKDTHIHMCTTVFQACCCSSTVIVNITGHSTCIKRKINFLYLFLYDNHEPDETETFGHADSALHLLSFYCIEWYVYYLLWCTTTTAEQKSHRLD